MSELKEDLEEELDSLYDKGSRILISELKDNEHPDFDDMEIDTSEFTLGTEYQEWYSEALPVIKQILPDRYEEFRRQYELDDSPDEIDFTTYTISDYLIGLRVTRGYAKEEVVNPMNAFVQKFQKQLSILGSARSRIESRLSDIEGVLQANLFDSEIQAARDLSSKGLLRAAGALAGVTLEAHLSKVADNHNVSIQKSSATISTYNQALKKNDIIDIPVWRRIQRLGDIRNLCVHDKERDPTGDEVDDLIRGTKKLTKTLF